MDREEYRQARQRGIDERNANIKLREQRLYLKELRKLAELGLKPCMCACGGVTLARSLATHSREESGECTPE